jgi:hypothetical protein
MDVEKAHGSFGSLAPLPVYRPTSSARRVFRPTGSVLPTRRFAHSPFRLFAALQRGLEGMPTECCAFQALRKFLYPGEST